MANCLPSTNYIIYSPLALKGHSEFHSGIFLHQTLGTVEKLYAFVFVSVPWNVVVWQCQHSSFKNRAAQCDSWFRMSQYSFNVTHMVTIWQPEHFSIWLIWQWSEVSSNVLKLNEGLALVNKIYNVPYHSEFSNHIYFHTQLDSYPTCEKVWLNSLLQFCPWGLGGSYCCFWYIQLQFP